MAGSQASSRLQKFEGLPIILVFALLLMLFMYTAPQVFLQPFIYTTFLSTLPPLVLLAVGLTFVIGAGEIDLSFPAIISFSGFVFAVLFKEYDLGWLAVLAGFASGLLVGVLNGFLVAKIGIPSFMATLATQFFWAGMATVLSGGKSYALRGVEREPGLAMDRRTPLLGFADDLDCAASDPVAMDSVHRRHIVVRAQSPPFRRARAIHR